MAASKLNKDGMIASSAVTLMLRINNLPKFNSGYNEKSSEMIVVKVNNKNSNDV